MSVMLEFTVGDEEFTLGRIVSGSPPMRVELERVVPTGNTIMPFLWVTGEEFEAFERKVASRDAVTEITAVDRVDDSALYRLLWTGERDDLIRGIIETEATVLDAHSDDDGWVFRLRFLDHDSLSDFYNYCTDRDISIHITRTYTLTERTESGYQFDLTPEQREALLLGLREGYFETPSRADLDDLAEELDISQQALSDRIRRGTEQVLGKALLTSAADFG